MEAAVQAGDDNQRLGDSELVQRVQSGDVHSFAELVRRYQDRIFNTCRQICPSPEDAADVTQDAFLKAYRSIGSFSGQSGFHTWIYRIAVNTAISERRRTRLRFVASLDDADDGGSPLVDRVPDTRTETTDEAIGRSEMAGFVEQALRDLESQHRTVVVLRDIEDLDYREIADILEIPIGTVKSRVHRARVALREAVERQCKENGSASSGIVS
jgi:RNA polymerase sigma-70 factor, ECF subfamily